MARLSFTLLESVDKILRCYHSNGFLWQNVCIVIFISLDFTKRNLTFFVNFSFRIFFGVRGFKGLKEIGNLLYQCLIYNLSLKKNGTRKKNQWYSCLNYRTHYTMLRKQIYKIIILLLSSLNKFYHTFSWNDWIDDRIRCRHSWLTGDWSKQSTMWVHYHCVGCWWRQGRWKDCLWTLKWYWWAYKVILLSEKGKKTLASLTWYLRNLCWQSKVMAAWFWLLCDGLTFIVLIEEIKVNDLALESFQRQCLFKYIFELCS